MARVTDMRHYLGMDDPQERASDPARRLGRYLGRIVQAATAGVTRGTEQATVVRCRRRPGRRACAGRIAVQLTDVPSRIRWWCTVCEDRGVISNWRHTPWDLSVLHGASLRDVICVPLPDEIHEVLDEEEWEEAALVRLIKGARVDLEEVRVQGPVECVAQLRDQVAERIDAMRRPTRRRQLLGQAYLMLDIGCSV